MEAILLLHSNMLRHAYMEIKLNLRWQMAKHDIDPILFTLLEGIVLNGSLQKATQHANVSYRFAWGLLNKWQDRLQKPLVILERGRGARLSAAGQALINANQKLTARFSPELDNVSTQFKQELETILSTHSEERTTIYASHGLAVSTLRDLMHQQSDLRLDLHFHGSLDCIQALDSQQCNLAGFHIPEAPFSQEISSHYLSTLSPDSHQLIYIVKRNQGLMVSKDNDKQISGIASLCQQNIQFINRQANSGTRLLFDHLLKKHAISASQITGYDNEEFTHMAVAAMIASGAADVGFGIAPMAEKFNLEFIPLVWEHYCLAVPQASSHSPAVQQIITILKSDAYKQQLAGLSGYDVTQSGEVVPFNKIFA